jgi:hypothetical protein
VAPSIVWMEGPSSGDAVVWTESSASRADVRGATVTSRGAVLDVDASGNGTVLKSGAGAAKIASDGDDFALLTSSGNGVWDATSFCATCSLDTVGALPRVPLFESSDSLFISASGQLDGKGRGPALMLPYARRDGNAGGVARVFSRGFAPAVPKRRVVAR